MKKKIILSIFILLLVFIVAIFLIKILKEKFISLLQIKLKLFIKSYLRIRNFIH